MSSLAVRESFIDYLSGENSSLELFDLTELWDFSSLPKDKRFLAIQFVTSDEEQIQIPDCFEETGRVNIHYMSHKRDDIAEMLYETDNIRKQFRGKRINLINIQNVGTPKVGTPEAIKVYGSLFGITFYVDYFFRFEKGD